MQRLLHKTEDLIVRYYHLISDSANDPAQNRRVLNVKSKLDNRPKSDIVKSALNLSKEEDAPELFKVYCEMVALTGRLD